MDYYIIFNSVYTPNMCVQICGNHTDDFATTWRNIKETVKMIQDSPRDFYIVGFGFMHVRGSFGHDTTRVLIKNRYDVLIPFRRTSVKLNKGWVIVPAYSGPRLPEGETRLPKGAKLVPMITLVNM